MMLRLLTLLLSLCLAPFTILLAQMGFNLPTSVQPVNDFEFYSRNNFVVKQKYQFTTVNPALSVNNLSCATMPASISPLAGILKDPSGDGPYSANQNCFQNLSLDDAVIGIEITFEQLDTEANDDKVVLNTDITSLTFSGTSLPPTTTFAGKYLTVTFLSDGDATIGQGFRLRWRALVGDNPPLTQPVEVGNTLRFNTVDGWFKAGGPRNVVNAQASAAIGEYNTVFGPVSAALGIDNVIKTGSSAAITLGNSNTAASANSMAIGYKNVSENLTSVAIGSSNSALSNSSLALGTNNRSDDSRSVAIGYRNVSQGVEAITMGSANTATADQSAVIGWNSAAGGQYTMAMGRRVSTNSLQGSFILGDNTSTTAVTTTTNSNQFTARFTGGFRMITAINTSGVPTAGVSLTAGGTSWATLSDSSRKELFLPVDGPDLLRKIGGMKLTTWNYKGQRGIRHYGPMAQEFFSLFGRDEHGTIGTDRLITTQDIEGLTLTAVQALVRENEQFKIENAGLKKRTERLEQQIVQLRKEQKNQEDFLEARFQRLENNLPKSRKTVATLPIDQKRSTLRP
ncbi:hypothetical protein IC229_14935 [Spirosoma sp. BT702]|uniref:Peptidase S74 domain-containing protein n=1 Tax=Spirosoma profusum TaxID=2771354 RepID=A0A926Y102_9BACT|nr:tail fiber domain-containing protein [Spirosoma profusum]MBD2701942.1 hypothetical protein [Spirosoma profusum]